MNEQEINKIIAEYDGKEYDHENFRVIMRDKSGVYHDEIPYTKSLDMNIPVVEKLGLDCYLGHGIRMGENLWTYATDRNGKRFTLETELSPALALSTALAKAILEKGNG